MNWAEFWRKGSPKRCLNLSWAPLPASKVYQGVACLRKRGATFGTLREGPRPWPCRCLRLWPWPRSLCPPPLLAILKPGLAEEPHWEGRPFRNRPQSQLRPPLYFYPRLSALLGRACRDHTVPILTLPQGKWEHQHLRVHGPGAEAGALLLTTARARGYSHSHFTPGKTKAQGGDMTCLRSPFW